MATLPTCLVVLAVAAGLEAQTETTARFEVASIRPTPAGERGSGVHTNDGSIRTHNTTVVSLIAQAYGVHDYQISGGPGWARSDGYDINAKFDPDEEKKLTREQQNELMQQRGQNLLADRFQLKLREETKEMPIYALVIAKGGHKMKTSEAKGQSVNTSRTSKTGKITAKGALMENFARNLGGMLERPVIDESGLKGRFDFEMSWSSDEDLSANSGPSLFTALQEQLGLKLESRKGPVKLLVIEQVERPSDN